MLTERQLADVRDRNPIPLVAELLGARLKRRGRTFAGTCPMCGGGKSAQRFEVKSDATWVCAVCADGGDVIRLIEKAKGLSFLDAVAWLGAPAFLSPDEAARRDAKRAAEKAKREANEARFRENERRRLYGLWLAARPIEGTAVQDYLGGRGITALDGLILRCAPAVPYFHGETQDELGRTTGFPRKIHCGWAMLAPGVDGGGTFRGLHITWIDPDRPGHKAAIVDPETGELASAKKMRGSRGGCWYLIERGPIGPALMVGEGLETTLSARQADRERRFSYATAGDLGSIGGRALETVPHPTLKGPSGRPTRVPGPEPDFDRPGLPIPEVVSELTLIGDADSDAFLTRMALIRGERRYAKPGRRVASALAPEGQDLNDALVGRDRA